MRRNTLLQSGLAILAVCFVGIIVGTIWLGWTGQLEDTTASLIIGGISAFASALLAIATYTTVLQNRRTVEELQKDREKPLVEDVLRQFVVPHEKQVNRHVVEMERVDPTWIQVVNEFGERSRPSFYRELSINKGSTARRKLRQDNPELLDELRGHNQMVQEIDGFVEQSLEMLRERILYFLENHYGEPWDMDPEELRALSECVFQEDSEGIQPGINQDLWVQYSQQLFELKGDEMRSEQNRLRSQYHDYSVTLRDNIRDYKAELQQKYGISEQDL